MFDVETFIITIIVLPIVLFSVLFTIATFYQIIKHREIRESHLIVFLSVGYLIHMFT